MGGFNPEKRGFIYLIGILALGAIIGLSGVLIGALPSGFLGFVIAATAVVAGFVVAKMLDL